MGDHLDYIKHLAQGYDRDWVLRDLIETFGSDVWNFAFFLTRRSDAADDLSQEVFLAAYNGLYSYRGECSVKSWLLTITRNKALHYLKSAFIRKVTLTDRFIRRGISPAAEQVLFDKLESRALWDAVMQLPRKYREVLVLAYHYGLSLKEIAELMQISEGTVKSRSHMFHFEDPLETFIGKTLTIQAIHLQSGEQETLSTELITMPNSGYSGLERYTAQFALPLGGMWRFEVLLDGKIYGNVLLSMLDPSWEISPEFRSGTYLMRGLEKQVGFIDAGFIAGRSQKYMWHFWGSNEQLDGPFKVKAVKRDSNEIIEVFSSNSLSSANALAGELNGGDRHVVASMLLPEAGRWRLLPYIRGRLLDTIVIEVK